MLSHLSPLNLPHCAVNRENLIWDPNNLPESTGKEMECHSLQLKCDLSLRVCIRAVLRRTHGFHKEGQRAGSTAVQHPWVFYQPPWLCHSWGTLPLSLLEIKPTTPHSSFSTKHLFLLNDVKIWKINLHAGIKCKLRNIRLKKGGKKGSSITKHVWSKLIWEYVRVGKITFINAAIITCSYYSPHLTCYLPSSDE